ncbi:hypothetical protein LVW35_02810 [Pseudomonas sp. HN11]|uniref:NEL-type E3 ubiquitin ligase domain-containing protein n=1 Tax=Pseudomonas sp. HN11 TaxID=1344094 RepID=UPI001F186D26|nr:NEL-type E3 ubiquitin ligase domain-containing protein [Pseudomonas sp. HN11]UII72128.1 hypothetical protein LVW35_02810 [Pseudomonas sp. HN11]
MPETIPSTSQSRPPISRSLHGVFIEQSIPDWLINATPERLAAFKAAPAQPPLWYRQATPAQRQALHTQTIASFTAQISLDKAMAGLQGVDQFVEPLLVQALKDQFNVTLDVNNTFLQLRQAVEVGILGIDVASYDVLKLPLLQAALHNFEASESESGAFHETSGFIEKDSITGLFKPVATTLTVAQFTGLCRSLDVGAKYQVYLKDYVHPKDGLAGQVLREKFTTAQKAALRVAAEMALLKKDIEPDDYRMILSVIAGEQFPRLGGKPVWFRDLSLMKHRMTGCVIFVISEKYRYTDEVIVYIPHDPYSPLKRYTAAAMDRAFKQRFTERDARAPNDGNPTPYQRFFSQFVDYADLPDYFSQLTEAVPDASFARNAAGYAPLLNEFANGFNPFSIFTEIRHLPPGPPPARKANPDPFLAPTAWPRAGHGLWVENIELWGYLFDQQRAKLIADARAHAVPTADVDARVRSEKLARLLNLGMLLLTTVSMFVPGLGELMLVVMAGQLLYESFAGAIEWSEGDRQAAKAHLLDVAQNLALLAVTAGAGKGLAKLASVKAEPVIESLESVTLPNGETRLWKPDLSGYEQAIALNGEPNTQGQFQRDGKTYIRLEGNVYEQVWDTAQKRWRIRHPTDTEAYQPLLEHNGSGAWRHTLERPLSWDRLTLLRRMGTVTEGLSDETLLKAADISGVEDNTLRKMHLDNDLPPPALIDALRLLEADQGVVQVIEQLEGARPINGRYLYSLPLVTQMPRWPLGRVLEVFEGAQLRGRSVKYGSERVIPLRQRKASIRISRADVLSGDLPQRILAQMSEREITSMLGGEPARVIAARPQEFSKQLADFARTRKPAIFESLYKGNEPRSPWVARLQRECPGLSDAAAHRVLAQADAEEVARMQSTHKLPLHLLEQGRWYAGQGRLARAYAGLYGENMASPDSYHLALQTLAKLPGWPQDLRLEVRDGNVSGTLLDAIGEKGAGSRKYLVKRGPSYQAFDERGEALNSVPVDGDNFYASLMHALPDETRQSLKVPEVSRYGQLQSKISEYAVEHRLESARIVSGRSRHQPWFRPPQRITASLLGYPASGRGEGVAVDLRARVQAVYPTLTDDQADGFILAQMLNDRSDQDIVHRLNTLQREWQTLASTLDQWVAEPPVMSADSRFWGTSKSSIAQAIKDSWRHSPLASDSRYATLELFCNEPLPALEADFSYVRHLRIGGYGLTDANSAALLATFPNVESLRITVTSQQFRTVPDTLGTLNQLTDLTISTQMPAQAFAQEQVAKLEQLTQLKSLTLDGVTELNRELDVSRLTQLRSLTLSRGFYASLPTGALQLPHLERLNLKGATVRTLPQALLLPGHERLWRGLSLDWARLDGEQFRGAYDYVRIQPEHLADQEEMVGEYCKAQLDQLSARSRSVINFPLSLDQSTLLRNAFLNRWIGAQTRFDAIEALRAEHAELTERLEAWKGAPTLTPQYMMQMRAAEALNSCWYNGVLQRYGIGTYATALDLSNVSALELPNLPTQGFSHVQDLNLQGLRAPLAQVRGFIRGFSELRSLNLNDCALSEWPMQPGDLSKLEHLDLGRNPMTHVDVSNLSGLRALNLSGTGVQAWPTGAEHLVHLSWLDLRDTPITALPSAALVRDNVVLSLNLHGAALDVSSQSALTTALQRVEQARALPVGALARFAAEEEATPRFPPQETASTVAHDLLTPAPQPTGEGPTWREQSIRRIRPDYSEDQVRKALQQLRVEHPIETALDTLLGNHNQALDRLTRELNGWSFIHRSTGDGWEISSRSRTTAASRIVECWRQGVLDGHGLAPFTLDLNGLQLGDLPTLSGEFSHVGRLDLTGVRLSAQGSNGFLRSFVHVRRLTLSGQSLTTLPEAVVGMPHLDQLGLASIDLTDPAPLYPTLRQLTQLRVLDLGYNNLSAFSVEQLSRLEDLDLSQNLLHAWPQGALQAPRLRRLNLSGNEIAEIPERALEGGHETLMAGVDLSDNRYLSAASLQRLRDYADSRGLDSVLGLSLEELEGESDGEPLPDEPDEQVSEEETQAIPEQLAPWLEALAPTEVENCRALWQRLAAEPGNQAFFHLLLMMRDTQEYQVFRGDLTRRVWSVLEAADRNTELRESLFSLAATHGTCIDGRTLTFSNLEVKTFEYNALRDVPAGLEQRGQALLKLSRQLFRLGQVERLAGQHMARNADAAEVRLSYRIGLTRGWSDGLQLPGQPRSMRFDRPVEGEVRAAALREIEQAETTQQFYDELISRDYWVRYLEDKYPDQFSDLQRRLEEKQSQVEDEHPDISTPAYAQAMQSLEVERGLERNAKLLALSRQEEAALAPPAADPDLEVLVERAPGTPRGLVRSQARPIVFNDRTYFVASMPDTGDGLNYLLWVPSPDDPQALVSSGIMASPDVAGVWRRSGRPGGMVTESSDDEYELASESMPVQPFTAEELSTMRRADHFATTRNVLGSYNRALNGKYPLRDFQGRPMRISKLERSVQVRPGVTYTSDQIKPYIQFGGHESVARLYDEKLQLRPFTAADMKAPQEHTLVGQSTVVANRRIAKGEMVGVYAGTVMPSGMVGTGGNTFTMTVGSRQVLEGRTLVTEPITLSGDNIISRINTLFEYDANGKPVRQARQGYNVENVAFDIEAQMLLGVGPEAKSVSKKLLLNTVWAIEDIPAGSELRMDYRYTQGMIKTLYP